VDHAARYQLLDHATDESPLWDVRKGITTITANEQRIDRHGDRKPEELRPELERLVLERHVEIYEATDPNHRVLSLDEALSAIADDRNWYSPSDLGEPDRRETIYALYLTETGGEEFRKERAQANPD
jgi:hypothetical protein